MEETYYADRAHEVAFLMTEAKELFIRKQLDESQAKPVYYYEFADAARIKALLQSEYYGSKYEKMFKSYRKFIQESKESVEDAKR